MTAIDSRITLAQLVNERPRTASTLDRLGLDYCCGGQRTLAAAAGEVDLELDEVLRDLADAEGPSRPAPWAGLGSAELADHIEATHHAYLHEALPRLEALAEKVASVHAGRHPEVVEVHRLVTELRSDLEPHMAKEEQVLFPSIRRLDGATTLPVFHCGRLSNPISVMRFEHDRAGELLGALRSVTDGHLVPDDACASYRVLYDGLAELEADIHLHVHKENNVLFPAVLAAERALIESSVS